MVSHLAYLQSSSNDVKVSCRRQICGLEKENENQGLGGTYLLLINEMCTLNWVQ